MKAEFGLKRVLGLKELVAIEVGTTVGAGVFVLTGMALEMGGPLLPFAYLLAAVPVVFMMLSLAMLGSAVPTVGGTYRYPSRLLSPAWAFVGVWVFALGMVFGAFPLYALRGSEYLLGVFPWFEGLDPVVQEQWIRILAILWLTIFFLANLCGLAIAAAVQGVMVLVLLASLVHFGVLGLGAVSLSNMQPVLPHGIGGFLASSALLTFALLGANSVIELGGEIRDPGRNIPRSLFISIPLVAGLYFVVGFVAAGALPWSEAAGELLVVPARTFLGPVGLRFFILGGAVLAITTTLNATFMWATKSLMIVAHDGLIPAGLAGTNRFGAPYRFLAIIWALGVTTILVRVPTGTFEIFASVGGIVIFIPVMLSALLLRKKLPERYAAAPFKLEGPLYWICPVVGVLLALVILGMLLSQLEPLPLVFFLAWLAAGAVYYVWRRPRLAAGRGRSVRSWMDEELEILAGSESSGQGDEPGERDR
ncbi:MAG: amino acid permease [Deltaproteobacteria bacterium]|nr:amino acid permease [Deltaproteobacteria bacterium]